ncbi:hypothetical protein ES702_06196 [subsurface metagenome]
MLDIGIKKGFELIPGGQNFSDSVIAINLAKSGIGLAIALKTKNPYYKFPALGILAQGLTSLAEPLIDLLFSKLNLGSLSVSVKDVSLEAPETDYIPW